MRVERNPNTLRVIVCGGRDFNDKTMLFRVLWYVHERRSLAEVIHGGQRGVEQMANHWAFEHGMHRVEVRAEWSKYGNSRAILLRNRQMFDLHPSGVIAFPGDVHSWTVVQSAREQGVPVLDAEALYSKILPSWPSVAEFDGYSSLTAAPIARLDQTPATESAVN